MIKGLYDNPESGPSCTNSEFFFKFLGILKFYNIDQDIFGYRNGGLYSAIKWGQTPVHEALIYQWQASSFGKKLVISDVHALFLEERTTLQELLSNSGPLDPRIVRFKKVELFEHEDLVGSVNSIRLPHEKGYLFARSGEAYRNEFRRLQVETGLIPYPTLHFERLILAYLRRLDIVHLTSLPARVLPTRTALSQEQSTQQ